MLKLAEMCRRLETEQEKILPFWTISEAVPLPQQEQEQSQEQQQLQQLQDSQLISSLQQSLPCPSQEDGSHAEAMQPETQSSDRAGTGLANSTIATVVGLPRLSTAGVHDDGREVEEWDYLNRYACTVWTHPRLCW